MPVDSQRNFLDRILAASSRQPVGDVGGGQTGDEDLFMAGGLAANDPDRVAWAGKGLGQELDHSVVCGGIDGRGGNFDLKLVALDLADGVFGGAGLDFEGEVNPFGHSL